MLYCVLAGGCGFQTREGGGGKVGRGLRKGILKGAKEGGLGRGKGKVDKRVRKENYIFTSGLAE